MITRNCHGYLPSQITLYLQNIHIKPRKIYLSLNAEIDGYFAVDRQRFMLNSNSGSDHGLGSYRSDLGFPASSMNHTMMRSTSGSIKNGNNDDDSSVVSNGTDGRTSKSSGDHLRNSTSIDLLSNLVSTEFSATLSETGREYTQSMARWLKLEFKDLLPIPQLITADKNTSTSSSFTTSPSPLLVLTGTGSVHTNTVSHLRMLFPCYNTPLLNELRGGELQGLTMEAIKVGYQWYRTIDYHGIDD